MECLISISFIPQSFPDRPCWVADCWKDSAEQSEALLGLVARAHGSSLSAVMEMYTGRVSSRETNQ